MRSPHLKIDERRTMRGFTLIEVMIVVAIVAILASIAYPSYMDSVRKGWRAEGRAALMQEMQQQERFFTQTASYRRTPFNALSNGKNPDSKYALDVVSCAAPNDTQMKTCIRLTATLRGNRTDQDADVIWLESTGVKGCTGNAPNRCWQ